MPQYLLDDDASLPSPQGKVVKRTLQRLPDSRQITLAADVLEESGISPGAVLYCRPQGPGRILLLALAKDAQAAERFAHLMPPEDQSTSA